MSEGLELRKKNEEFIQKIKESDPHFFEELKKGQTPEFFVLSCSDSRVSPSVITQMPLGHMFVHRNIANQATEEDSSFSASLYYALKHLKVKRIVVKGHTECGGIKAAWAGNNEAELCTWLQHVKGSLPKKEDHAAISLEELAKYNVIKQVDNILKHPVYMQYGQGVEVVGCMFHVETGKLVRVVP